ncbi:hypothetical protein [Thioalkalivibrio sp. ALE16]|uniref:hypothetical protein n=1 Tax=Thioalkalivibrio sp. ALE16 TaxID=1158172 RepID=UPI0012DEB549|nr:hypothetical protein [Thioalkalivibrio sp. ALE16]
MAEPTSQSVMEKFEFYFLALIFTLLGASVQTANFTSSPNVSIWMELVGWALLASSGIAGLSKVQWISSMLYTKSRKENYVQISRDLRVAQQKGSPYVIDAESQKSMPIQEVIAKVDENAGRFDVVLDRLGRKHEIKHYVEWWCFVAGLLAVGVARGLSELC